MDPVEAELTKYSIIGVNDWDKDTKCASPSPPVYDATPLPPHPGPAPATQHSHKHHRNGHT